MAVNLISSIGYQGELFNGAGLGKYNGALGKHLILQPRMQFAAVEDGAKYCILDSDFARPFQLRH